MTTTVPAIERTGRRTASLVGGLVVLASTTFLAQPVGAQPESPDRRVLAADTHLLAPRVAGDVLELGFLHLLPGDNTFAPPAQDREWTGLDDVVVHLPAETVSAIQPGSEAATVFPAWLRFWTTSGVSTHSPVLSWSTALVQDQLGEGTTLDVSLTAVTGPGHVRITPAHAAGPVSTVDGLPDTLALPAAGGVGGQLRWSFTAEGYYCLDLAARLPTGATGRAQLAVAVGSADPAAAPPCEPLQDGTVPTPAPAEPPARRVVNDANHNLRPRFDADGTLRLGVFHQLTSRNVNDTAPWSALGDTVLHLKDGGRIPWQDEYGWGELGEPGALLWQTGSTAGNGAYLFSNLGSPPANGWQPGTPVELTLQAASGPGHVVISNSRVDVRSVNSSLGLPATISRTAGRSDLVFTFTRPGYYCLDLELFVTRTDGSRDSDRQQWPVAVGTGIDPYAAPPCQQPPDGTLPEGAPATADEDPGTPDVLVFDDGHADFAARLDAQERLRLLFRLDELTYREFDDVVVHLRDAARYEIPAPDEFQDQTHVAPAGSTVWQVPLSALPDVPWLGYNTQAITDSDFLDYITWRMDGVTGIDGGPPPGDVVWGFGGGTGADPGFSTRTGFPDGRQLPSRSYGHGHPEINFTAPGVYCLDMTLSARLSSSGEPTDDRQLVTFVVGETADPATVTPCGRTGVDRDPTHPRSTTPATGDEVVVLGDRTDPAAWESYSWLEPTVTDDGLEVSIVEGTRVDGGLAHDASDVVFHAATQRNSGDDPWLPAPAGQQYWMINEFINPLAQETFGVSADELRGDLTWSLTGVEGPGAVAVFDPWHTREEGRAILSSRPGHEQSSDDLWPATVGTYTWGFAEAGVYCVGLRWTATSADGTEMSDEFALTFVAGTEIDPATVTPCQRDEPDQTPTPTPTPDPTQTPDPSPTPDPTPSPDPTPTSDPTGTPGPTSSPDPTPTPDPTSSPTPTPSQSPSQGESPEPTPGTTPGAGGPSSGDGEDGLPDTGAESAGLVVWAVIALVAGVALVARGRLGRPHRPTI